MHKPYKSRLDVQHPCTNCVYYVACGDCTRTTRCEGRATKKEKKLEERKEGNNYGR